MTHGLYRAVILQWDSSDGRCRQCGAAYGDTRGEAHCNALMIVTALHAWSSHAAVVRSLRTLTAYAACHNGDPGTPEERAVYAVERFVDYGPRDAVETARALLAAERYGA